MVAWGKCQFAVFARRSIVDLIFFFKQKTAYEMRISDWSSDVCSSDLRFPGGSPDVPRRHQRSGRVGTDPRRRAVPGVSAAKNSAAPVATGVPRPIYR